VRIVEIRNISGLESSKTRKEDLESSKTRKEDLDSVNSDKFWVPCKKCEFLSLSLSVSLSLNFILTDYCSVLSLCDYQPNIQQFIKLH